MQLPDPRDLKGQFALGGIRYSFPAHFGREKSRDIRDIDITFRSDLRYFGADISAVMSPDTFLNLASELETVDPNPEFEDKVITPLFLAVRKDESLNMFKVTQHNGRHRAFAISKTLPNCPVIVRVDFGENPATLEDIVNFSQGAIQQDSMTPRMLPKVFFETMRGGPITLQNKSVGLRRFNHVDSQLFRTFFWRDEQWQISQDDQGNPIAQVAPQKDVGAAANVQSFGSISPEF